MESLPKEVEQFVATHITCLGELDVLLLLRGAPDREWTADAVGSELRLPAQAAALHLARLYNLGLLLKCEEKENTYRYQPDGGIGEEVIRQVALLYRGWSVRLATLIYSQTPPPK